MKGLLREDYGERLQGFSPDGGEKLYGDQVIKLSQANMWGIDSHQGSPV